MIFQEPMTALNSVFKIKNQLIESILVHKKKSKKDAYIKAKELLLKVGISRQEEVLNSYPASTFRWDETTCHDSYGNVHQNYLLLMNLRRY